MKVRRALIGFGAITAIYLIALIWLNTKNQVFLKIPEMLSVMPKLFGLSLLTYCVRYLRWHWLLFRAGNKINIGTGFLAYLAGFAFTATPGKVGELLRIRYFLPQGVPSYRVIAAFIFERIFDLIAVLLLSTFAISNVSLFVFVLSFVLIFLTVIVLTSLNITWLIKAALFLRFYKFKKLSRLCVTLRNGLSGCATWVTPLDIIVSITMGLVAWGLASFSFILLLSHLNISIPALSSIGIYPLAILTGAASMLPGGLGSTDAAITALLSHFDVPLGTAILAAIGIQFSSIWFAVFCGFIALGVLEFRAIRHRFIR